MGTLMKVRNETWLHRTRQRWKLWPAYIAGLASVAAFLIAIDVSENRAPTAWVLACIGSGAGGYIWLVLSIRCNRCGRSIPWWAMSQMPVSRGFESMFALEACPVCGDRGGSVGVTTGTLR